MNYIGGKYRILPQILKYFPDNIYTFYDVFGGGGSVSLNVNAYDIYYNDIVNYISDFFNSVQHENLETALTKIHNVIIKYNLSKTNEIGFKQLRSDYNAGNKSWEMFYVLMCFSFNNQYRFNNKQEYNSSFGKYKSCYSSITENKFIKFFNRLQSLNISFHCKDFREIDYSKITSKELVYFDPPYLITNANYNDGKRGFKGWSQNDDTDLLNICDSLNSNNTKFAMSNVLECKGKTNDDLKKWASKYNVHNIESTYGNCNYHAKDKSKNSTVEVLITNY